MRLQHASQHPATPLRVRQIRIEKCNAGRVSASRTRRRDAAFRTDDDSAKVRGVVAAVRAKDIPPVLATLTDRWFTPEFAARCPGVIERRMQQVIDTNPDVVLSVFDIDADTAMAPWIGDITHPSLVLTGENYGGCNPRLNQRKADAIPHSELVILPHLRHAILLEAAEQVASPVRAFLGKQLP